MLLSFKTTADTWLTRKRATSADLPDSEKILVPINTKLSIVGITLDGGYLEVLLKDELDEIKQWYIRVNDLSPIQLVTMNAGFGTDPS